MIGGVLHKTQSTDEKGTDCSSSPYLQKSAPCLEDLSLETTCNLFIVRVIEILYLTVHTINLHFCTRPGIVY